MLYPLHYRLSLLGISSLSHAGTRTNQRETDTTAENAKAMKAPLYNESDLKKENRFLNGIPIRPSSAEVLVD